MKKPIIEYTVDASTALDVTWQNPFPATVTCEKCGGRGRHAVTIMESNGNAFISRRHPNKGKGNFWPHDAISFALYFCKDCFHAQVEWNQA